MIRVVRITFGIFFYIAMLSSKSLFAYELFFDNNVVIEISESDLVKGEYKNEVMDKMVVDNENCSYWKDSPYNKQIKNYEDAGLNVYHNIDDIEFALSFIMQATLCK